MTDLVVVAIYAVVFIGALLVVRGAIEIVPLDRSRREAGRRAMPVFAWLAAVAFALIAARRLLSDQPIVSAVAMLLVVVGFVAASWAPLRDVAAGVFLKAGQICREGDHIRAGSLEGKVARMGLSVMVLETRDGEQAIIPYGRITRHELLRTQAVDAVIPHVFRLPLHTREGLVEQKARIRRRALMSHWSVVSREPELVVHGDHLEVTVYAVDPDHGADIEADVRRELADGSLAPSGRERESVVSGARQLAK